MSTPSVFSRITFVTIMADPIAVFACSHQSARVGWPPCDVFHPRTLFLDPSSVGSITSTPLGSPETDRRSSARGRRDTRFVCARRCSARSHTRSLRNSAPKVMLPCPPRDQSWLPFPEHTVVDRHYCGGQAARNKGAHSQRRGRRTGLTEPLTARSAANTVSAKATRALRGARTSCGYWLPGDA